MDNKFSELKEVVSILNHFIPEECEKTSVYFEITDDSCEIFFYCLTKNTYTQCYQMENLKEENLDLIFDKIDEVIRNNKGVTLPFVKTLLLEKGKEPLWIDDNPDLSEGSYEYKIEWKQKYATVD